ncbi:hypothetical protein [Pelagicoccus sp. SDUM812002]|uniref:hypothetical protein n=1 Tax=Pelagicoccus sp. SDUM812002 TaxID=3041266 RepID=UPI00281055BF|nr:hypothetical protein [Pelagicoccus sp. SDUM812002]MDQ8184844.1 hypothetical protein [Pelagicoccus sp. SDUM812002]
MKVKTIWLLALIACSVAAGQKTTEANATSRFALGVEGGTTGLGGSVWFTASKQFTFNAGYGSLSEDKDYSTDGVDYSGNVDLSNGYATIQWHPGGGGFHLLAGVVFTENSVNVVGRPESGTTYDLDGVEYPASLVGTIVGDVEWDNSTAPYIGFGFSKKPEGKGWGAYINAGVMDAGSAVARLEATGLIADQPQFESDLRAEEQDLNDELDEFDLYPVVRLGVMYRF